MKPINLVLAVLIMALPAAAGAETLEAGQLTASSGSEVGAVPDKIRDQIAQLTKAIHHGAPQFMMVGKAEPSGAGYVINGDTFIVNKDTVIHGDFKPGAYVEVRGELIQGKEKVASQIVVAAQAPAKKGASSASVSSRSSLLERAQEAR